MKCMVQWEGRGECHGPYEVTLIASHTVNLVADGYRIIVPRSWTIGIDNGWIVWEGGECPVSGKTIVSIMDRNGYKWHNYYAEVMPWQHSQNPSDIIAYRIMEHQPMPLSTIMDRSLWWLERDSAWVSVEAYFSNMVTNKFRITDGRFVSRDWFTGREHRRGEDFDAPLP